MTGNKKSLPKAKPEGIEKRDCANDRTARLKYTAFRQDDKLPEAFSRLRKATPEPRLCVYGIPESVPFLNGGHNGRYS